jgi:NAD-dependent protein deacetylase/lipoamidase
MGDAIHTRFAWDDGLDAAVARAAALLMEASHAVALTGAGLSVESGIPPFRGPDGIWTKYGEPPMDGYQRFLRDPGQAWRERLRPREEWARVLAEAVRRAEPNEGHRALAELEAGGFLACLITQNIDDLHRRAGQRALLEIHGNHRLLRCIDCHTRYPSEEMEIDSEQLPPRCGRCGGIVKGDVVQFGEPIPPDVLRRCFEEVEGADCMLVAGTSATVYPAAEFPFEVARRGGAVIEVNPEASELTPLATVSLRGPGGAVLGRLAEHVAARARERSA